MMCVAALKYAGCSLSDGFIKAKHFGISIFFHPPSYYSVAAQARKLEHEKKYLLKEIWL